MCGIFAAFSSDPKIIKKISSKKQGIAETIEKRGPDKTSVVEDKNFIAIHTLLSMTGLRIQPVVTEDMVLLFNGEIYNDYEKYDAEYSDTDLIINYFNRKARSAFEFFDGEYAICIYLKKKNQLLLASDPFGTKPLYYQIGKNFCLIGSYATPLKNSFRNEPIYQFPPNTLAIIDLNNYQLVSQQKISSFDFSKQTNMSYENWIRAFQNALIKRTFNTKHRTFVSLSSGHDSGLIAAELINLRIPFHAYIMTYLEDQEIIKERIKILKKHKVSYEIVSPTRQKWAAMKRFVSKNIDPYQLVNPESSFQNYDNPDIAMIPGTISGAIINEKAREESRLISLSGQGGDEIFADYFNEHTYSRMSELKGNWHGVNKPWKNFAGGWNRVFLGANERISGLFGVESRYPFLDFKVVQEFLNLHPDYKSKYYKAPITYRLKELKFPYHLKKYGFAGFKDDSLSTRPA